MNIGQGTNNGIVQTGTISNEPGELEKKVDEISKKQLSGEKSFLETYNLTHDNSNGYELKFDDTNWTRNINTLKPIVILMQFKISLYLI